MHNARTQNTKTHIQQHACLKNPLGFVVWSQSSYYKLEIVIYELKLLPNPSLSTCQTPHWLQLSHAIILSAFCSSVLHQISPLTCRKSVQLPLFWVLFPVPLVFCVKRFVMQPPVLHVGEKYRLCVQKQENTTGEWICVEVGKCCTRKKDTIGMNGREEFKLIFLHLVTYFFLFN